MFSTRSQRSLHLVPLGAARPPRCGAQNCWSPIRIHVVAFRIPRPNAHESAARGSVARCRNCAGSARGCDEEKSLRALRRGSSKGVNWGAEGGRPHRRQHHSHCHATRARLCSMPPSGPGISHFAPLLFHQIIHAAREAARAEVLAAAHDLAPATMEEDEVAAGAGPTVRSEGSRSRLDARHAYPLIHSLLCRSPSSAAHSRPRRARRRRCWRRRQRRPCADPVPVRCRRRRG